MTSSTVVLSIKCEPVPRPLEEDTAFRKMVTSTIPLFGAAYGIANMASLQAKLSEATRLERAIIQKVIKQYNVCVGISCLTGGLLSLLRASQGEHPILYWIGIAQFMVVGLQYSYYQEPIKA